MTDAHYKHFSLINEIKVVYLTGSFLIVYIEVRYSPLYYGLLILHWKMLTNSIFGHLQVTRGYIGLTMIHYTADSTYNLHFMIPTLPI